MKIALLANHNVIHAIRWANSLADRGHAVFVFSLHPEESGSDELNPAIKRIRLPVPPPWGYYLNAPVLKYYLRQIKPDLINAHYASGYGTLGRLSGFHPYILSVWGSDVYDFPKQSLRKRRLLVENLVSADLICSTSHAMGQEVERLHAPLPGIVITPFGVDIGKFSPPQDSSGSSTITIGTVKKLEDKYGIDTLIRSFASVREDLQQTDPGIADRLRLLIVGKGTKRKRLAELSVELGLEQIVSFAGAIPNDQVPQVLGTMDIYVALSRLDSESFGVAIIEAGACGLPVVVSDADGPAEVVVHNKTGIIVPRDNVEEAAAALKRLILDEPMRKRMGVEGREHVVASYDWEHCVDIMEDVYKRMIPAD